MVTIRNNTNWLPDRGNYYRSETKYLAQLVGHEIPEEKRNFFKALAYTNSASQLGLDDFDVEVIGRMLTALSKQTRFFGTQGIAVGENAATHSLNCVNILEKIISQMQKQIASQELLPALASEKDAAIAENITQQKARLSEVQQYTGLSLIMHDLAEILGEPKTATGVSVPAENGYSAFEQKVLEATLKRAITSARDDVTRNGRFTDASREAFASQIATLVDGIAIERRKEQAFKSYEEALSGTGNSELTEAEKQTLKEQIAAPHEIKIAELNALFAQGNQPSLAPEDKAKLDQYMALWEMAEYKQSERWEEGEAPANQAYIGQLVKAVDHIQGVRHYTRFGQKEVPSVGSSAVRFSEIDEKDKRWNLWYTENDAYGLHQKCAPDSPLENNLAMAVQNEIFATNIGFVDAAWRAYDVQGDNALTSEQASINQERLEIQEGLTSLYEDTILSGSAINVPSIGQKWIEAYEAARGVARPSPRVSGIMETLKTMVSGEALAGQDTAWKIRMETRRTQSEMQEASVA